MVKYRTSLAIYVSQLSRRLSQVLRKALQSRDATATHQARVITRRLSSAMNLVGPLLKKSSYKKVQKRLQLFRRRLGPLRDFDVMLAGAARYRSGHATAVRWFQNELRQRRSKARRKLSQRGPFRAADKWLDAEFLSKLEASQKQLPAMLRRMIRRDFDHFCKSADAVSSREGQTDLHALRIDGKNLRYTLEIAAAIGAPLPRQFEEQLKQIQDRLGEWHDGVVLAQQAVKLTANGKLALGNPMLMGAVFELVNAIGADAAAAVHAFATSWPHVRGHLSAAVKRLCSKGIGQRAA